MDTLQTLQQILNNRLLENKKPAENKKDSSYVLQLMQKGLDQIAKKVAEESGEVLMAAKDYQHQPSEKNKKHLIDETTDLWFHSMILLTYCDSNINEVLQEISDRLGKSGIIEKNSRNSFK